jgi:3-oxoadipate enol-lactonase
MEITINEIKISYHENGMGFPLVFIHGFPLSKDIWRPQWEGLADATRSIAPDLRGFGDSQSPSGTYTMELLAKEIASFMDGVNVIAPILIGLSMGGYIAMTFCRRYARWLSGLVLTATRAHADTEAGKADRDNMITIANEKGAKAIADIMLPKLLAPKTLSENQPLTQEVRNIIEKASVNGIVGTLNGMKEREDSMEFLKTLDLPTLIIHGTEDQLFPVSEAEAMAKAIPNAELKVIPHAGHLVNLEQPQAFNDALRAFVKKF